jgi:hypothetical protein
MPSGESFDCVLAARSDTHASLSPRVTRVNGDASRVFSLTARGAFVIYEAHRIK